MTFSSQLHEEVQSSAKSAEPQTLTVAPSADALGATSTPSSLEAARSRISPRALASMVLLAAALVVGRQVLDRPSFPVGKLGISVGSWFDSASTWFVDNMGWLYNPVATGLTNGLADVNNAFTFTPAPQIALVLILLVFCVAGVRLALLTAVALAWSVASGVWEPMMQTLAFMIIAVAVSCALGIGLGIVASLDRRLDSLLRSALDGMQAFPIFAYLVPVVLVFGTGDTGALIVTIIWAMPPVARMTVVGLSGVPEESIESATSFGATRLQLLRSVRLPLARPSISAGVNQTIMFAISMATVSAIVGGNGLGQVVWSGLSRLAFGDAIEGGVALVLLAVILDRATSPKGEKVRKQVADLDGSHGGVVDRVRQFAVRHPKWSASVLFVVLLSIVINAIPSLRYADFTQPPAWMALDLRKPSDTVVNWTTIHFGGLLDFIRTNIQLHGLNPVLDVLRWIPWPAMVVGAFLAGLTLIGIRGAVLVGGGIYLIGAMGMWDPTIITVAVVGVSVAIAVAIGFPLGVAMSRSDRVAALIRPVLDFLQTLPIFLFVIPAVIFMGSGQVTGTLATVCYALPPIIRLTNVALRNADPEVVEAAESFGATERQILMHVRAPLGLPTILVGLNQTVLLALSMAVVAAFVGTPGLGEEILVAVSGANFGNGVEAGISMFILALVFDRLFRAWTTRISIGSHLKVM